MPYFAVVYTYDSRDDERAEVRPTHRAYLAELTEAGSLTVSGPYAGDGAGGALLIFSADDEAAARELVAHDPFVLAGLVEDLTVREWTPVSGALAPQF